MTGTARRDTNMTIVTPAREIPRDRYGRPLVIPPGGGKPVAYTRCTTFIDVLEDKYNLQKWMQRQVALGLAARRDLILGVQSHTDDKRALDALCADAREAAASSAAATTGTALHSFTEMLDRGQKLPTVDAEVQADLDAYAAATKPLKPVLIEQFCVQDTLKIGGTPDRVVKYKGKKYIADLKTGSVEWGALKIAMQLAVYARSQAYDIATGDRARHDADRHRGIIIHLPAGQAHCQLHWVDLEEGWHAVHVARQVREKRRLKFGDLTEPFEAATSPTTPTVAGLAEQVTACATADAVRALWADHAAEWTDELTALAKAHIAKLPA